MIPQDRAVPQLPDVPEVFTAKDYNEARAMEHYIDVIALDMELPNDPHGKPPSRDVSKDVELLNITEGPHLTEALKTLLLSIEETAERVSDAAYHTDREAAESFKGIKAREMYNLKPFNQQLRYLCSRFMVEYVERDAGYQSDYPDPEVWFTAAQMATHMLKQIPAVADSIYKNDIPAYSVLYDLFDDMRKDGENPVEIYLGRDGIYAYYGRLGQNAARGDNDPDTDEYPVPGAKLVIKEDPKYIVYSRDVMYYADRKKKEEYIAQFIDEEDDVHFYDTGYNGSIPQDIMRILGFSEKEIDQRIHMLDATRPERQLQGVDKHLDIMKIENGPKTENASIGLVKSVADGQVKYVTTPSSIEEQFRFLVARDVLLRHFWIREYKEISADMAHVGIKAS